MNQHIGKQSIKFKNPPSIVETASIVGKKEGEGPLYKYFDNILDDDYWGEDTWEKAESKLQKEAAKLVMRKSNIYDTDIEYILGGDLINQCVGANYAMSGFDCSFFGLYGACSTMAESLSLGAIITSGGFAKHTLCITSSHFCTAEKQFRYPLEYGGQRTPTSQWTVTASGCAILSNEGNGPYITHITTGKIVDMGISDINNMGAAMAPAAADTLITHFNDTGMKPTDYDLILTGDLGVVGSDILCDILNQNGYDIYTQHKDAGKMIFDIDKQDVHAGGSGCGCCASVFAGYVFKELKKNSLNRVLVMATGALMNPMTVQQGSTIPGIAHAVSISNKTEL
ncbi:MAG: stage V sporulation protein AD [Clostridia bacterium]|nr:stage V sporulation protein AD [Clostridia bacterium]